MPVLTAYIGLQSVNGLIFKSSEDYQFYTYPYVYSPEVMSGYYSGSAFYKAVFEYFCEQSKVKFSDCDILLTGFFEPHILDFKIEYASIDKVLEFIKSYNSVLVNNFAIVTQLGFKSFLPLEKGSVCGKTFEPDEQNYYSNMTIYPQIFPVDLSSQIDLDSNISKLICNTKIDFSADKPILFMGSRFTGKKYHKELDYLLMISLIRDSGIYKINVDEKNTVILSSLMQMQNIKNSNIDHEPVSVGTLISTKGPLECMVSTDIGTSQVIELQADKFFVLPLGEGSKAKIVLKSQGADAIEKEVSGGSLGLIFDTRENKEDLIGETKLFNESMKIISGAMQNSSVK